MHESGRDANASSPGALLRAESLVKSYGSVTVVRGVSLEVAPGGSLGIVGESGSGKSTIAKMLVGLTAPDAGTINYLDEDRTMPARRVRDRRRRGRQIQMVFQNPYESLNRSQTVGDAMREVLAIHAPTSSPADREARIRELLELVGVPDAYFGALPGRMSGGLRQRVAIARALAADPGCIILDEAVSALDVSIQAQIINLLNDLRREVGVSYLFISHDLAVVRELTTDVIVMRKGEIVERGSTADVLSAPTHPYTRRLRESVPGPGWVAARTLGKDYDPAPVG